LILANPSRAFVWFSCQNLVFQTLGFLPYTVKKVIVFPALPAGMSLTKLSLAGNNLIISRQGEFG
jgi:hypothetical protein